MRNIPNFLFCIPSDYFFPFFFFLKIHPNKHSSLIPLAKVENTELGGKIIFTVRQTKKEQQNTVTPGNVNNTSKVH